MPSNDREALVRRSVVQEMVAENIVTGDQDGILTVRNFANPGDEYMVEVKVHEVTGHAQGGAPRVMLNTPAEQFYDKPELPNDDVEPLGDDDE